MTMIYRDIINGTRELVSSVINNRLNNVMKYLTSITLVMAIPTIISGLYGMNVVGNGCHCLILLMVRNYLYRNFGNLYFNPADLKKEKYVVTPETTILPIIKLEINITKNVLFFTENDIEISRCL